MILVEVYVPALDERYDFKVNEDVPIARVTEEIGEILTSEYGRPDPEMIKRFMLCTVPANKVLPMDESLRRNGVGNGSMLMLV